MVALILHRLCHCRALEVRDEAGDQGDIGELGLWFWLSVAIEPPKPWFVTVGAFLQRCIVTSVTDAGGDTAVKPQGLNFCKRLGLGTKNVFRFEVWDLPRLWDHFKMFLGELSADEERKGTANCKLVL